MDASNQIGQWFEQQGWQPFPFQQDVWEAARQGESGLIHAATGTGKTYAAWGAAILRWLDRNPDPEKWKTPKLQVIWLTPLKALAADTEQALQAMVDGIGLPWTIERRTGDTSSYRKQKQLKTPPACLITTPESLSIMLSRSESKRIFNQLSMVVVDEWHELLGSKRGTQTELCLARLRSIRNHVNRPTQPTLVTWGLSATLGNLEEALTTLVGVSASTETGSTSTANAGRMVEGLVEKEIVIDSLIPASMERFPWAGHLGMKMLPQVVDAVAEGQTALIFCNTRNQVERWYQAIIDMREDWIGEVALHHGSLSAETRQYVENALRAGTMRCVVATSSLDLGVDFPTVDRVLQVGSPKGVARLLQRAGRSGHQPGVTSRVTCVPTHALELIEVAAVRESVLAERIEGREPIEKPLDLLVQHVVTVALGSGFEPDALFDEVRTTYAYRHLTREEWGWVMQFVTTGGESLSAYPEYQKVVQKDAMYKVTDRRIANMHRSNIGTIVGDGQIQVKYLNGGHLGSMTESFISRLKPGDTFIFAGRPLKFVRVRDMTAWVRRASSVKGAIPRWTGTSLPISAELSAQMRQILSDVNDGVLDHPELKAVTPILRLQQKWSAIPADDELLIERTKTREGHHIFCYPFAGKLVHQGLAALVAYRLSLQQPITFTLTANDYGFELLSADFVEITADVFSSENLLEDIPASLNASEMARRQFREVARVAGLVNQGTPYRRNSARHIQSTSNLIYDVFAKYDSDNLLLEQAQREVLARQLDGSRMMDTLRRIEGSTLVITEPRKPTPLAFPLLIARIQTRLSSEKLADRIRRMTLQLEKWADK